MTSSLETNVQKEIWQLIQDMNETWVNGNPENLVKLFHEDMVISSPEFQEMGSGREVCVKSYKDFCEHATIHNLKETDPKIYVYGSTAIASYRFEIVYEMNGEPFHDTGRDVFAFIRTGSRWQAVWRMLILDSGNNKQSDNAARESR